MLKEIKSKYQKKNYEEVEYCLYEEMCPKCCVPFMIDDRYLKSAEFDEDYDYVCITCPYCGKKFFKHT